MFCPDTPSFYDDTWSHVELFSETFSIRFPITAHPTLASNDYGFQSF